MASKEGINSGLLPRIVLRLEAAASQLAMRRWVIFGGSSLVFFCLALVMKMPLILVLLPVAWSCFLYPMGAVFGLSIFIPFKAFIRSSGLLPESFLSFVIPIAILFAYLGFSAGRQEDKDDGTINYLALIFLASLFSTLGFALSYGFRTSQLLDFFIWLQLVGFFLLGRKALALFVSLRRFAYVNLAVMNLVSAWAVFQFLLVKSTPLWVEKYEMIKARAFGPLENPNALAGYLLLGLALAAVILTAKEETGKSRWRYLALALPSVSFLLTFSRGALAAGLFASLLLLAYKKKYRILGLVGLLVLFAFLVSPTAYKKRITNIFSGEHLSYSADSGRLWAIHNVFYINRNHMLFGSGWGSYGGEYAYGHASPTYLEGVQGGVVGVGNTDDQWLQVYAQQGVVGIWLYVLLFLGIFKRRPASPLLLPLLMFVILGFFADIFQFYQISFLGWMLMGAVSGKEQYE